MLLIAVVYKIAKLNIMLHKDIYAYILTQVFYQLMFIQLIHCYLIVSGIYSGPTVWSRTSSGKYQGKLSY